MGKIQNTIWLLTVECSHPGYPWVDGTLEETTPNKSFVSNSYDFWAKVYDEGSNFGINGGRISKLTISKNDFGRSDSDQDVIANYDRGWDIQPKDKYEKEVLKRIIDGLEETPERLG